MQMIGLTTIAGNDLVSLSENKFRQEPQKYAVSYI